MLDRMLKMNIGRTKTGQFSKNVDTENDDSEKKQEQLYVESVNVDNESLEIILQYYTTMQILEQFKEKISEDEYLLFVNKYGKQNNKTFEDYLINNISEIQLLNFIKEFNIQAWNSLINEMLNIII